MVSLSWLHRLEGAVGVDVDESTGVDAARVHDPGLMATPLPVEVHKMTLTSSRKWRDTPRSIVFMASFKATWTNRFAIPCTNNFTQPWRSFICLTGHSYVE